jgi:hypothetical protein
MDGEFDWLDEVVLLNESKSESVAGDVSVYRSEGDACASIEDWWVTNSEGYAFTATGVRLVLEVGSKGEVIVARREQCREGPAIVQGWLEALVQLTLDTRRRVAAERGVSLSRAEEAGAMPTSVEGMIAYVGFPWVPPSNWFMPGCLLLLGAISALLIIIAFRLF